MSMRSLFLLLQKVALLWTGLCQSNPLSICIGFPFPQSLQARHPYWPNLFLQNREIGMIFLLPIDISSWDVVC